MFIKLLIFSKQLHSIQTISIILALYYSIVLVHYFISTLLYQYTIAIYLHISCMIFTVLYMTLHYALIHTYWSVENIVIL